MEIPRLTPAERMYRSHLMNVANYQKRYPEKMKEKHRIRMEQIKADPEKHAEWKKKRRECDKRCKDKKKVEPECLGETRPIEPSIEPSIEPFIQPVIRRRR